MTQTKPTPSPRWFLVVSILAIVWNAMGCAAYLAHVSMTPETIAALSEAERALYESSPSWVNAAFAVAVWGGLLGTILLAMRRRLAFGVLALSLAGVLAQNIHGFAMTNAIEVYGTQALVMPALVIVIGIALLLFARHADAQGWMR